MRSPETRADAWSLDLPSPKAIAGISGVWGTEGEYADYSPEGAERDLEVRRALASIQGATFP
jgi:hypothetical protein